MEIWLGMNCAKLSFRFILNTNLACRREVVDRSCWWCSYNGTRHQAFSNSLAGSNQPSGLPPKSWNQMIKSLREIMRNEKGQGKVRENWPAEPKPSLSMGPSKMKQGTHSLQKRPSCHELKFSFSSWNSPPALSQWNECMWQLPHHETFESWCWATEKPNMEPEGPWWVMTLGTSMLKAWETLELV